MTLTDRQIATAIAALRYWQREGLNSSGHEVETIATNAGEFEAMDSDEIDVLCIEINRGCEADKSF